MAQFSTLGNENAIGLPVASKNPIELCRLKKIIAPHCYMEHGNIYGTNDVGKLYKDPAYNKKAWPDMPNPTPLAKQTDDTPVEYYKKLAQEQINAYMDNAFKKGYLRTFEEVTKKTPMFDISRIYYSDELERYSDPLIHMYEDEVDHLRNYGWTAFSPCLNKFTLRINLQRYLFIQVLSRNAKKKLLTLHIEDYAGNRFNWVRENDVKMQLQFKSTKSDTGELPMGDSCIYCENYDDFLTGHINDMGWSKKQQAFWKDVMGVSPLPGSIIIKMTPTKALLENKTVPNEVKQQFRILLHDRNDIGYLRTIQGMTQEIEVEDDESIAVLFALQSYGYLKISYIKAITALNLELSCDPQAEEKLSAPDFKQATIGRMTVTANGPLPIQMPKITT